MQPYLAPSDVKLSIQEKQFLFSVRSRMLDGNDGKKTLQCSAEFPEEQPHLIQWDKLSENEVTENLPKYNDIYSDNVCQLAKIGRLLKAKHEKLKQKNKLSNKTKPMHLH